MNPSWTGLLIGIVGLAVFEGVVSKTGAASNVGSFLGKAGAAVAKFLDPSIPLFSSTTSSTPTATTSSDTTTTPAATTLPTLATPSTQSVAFV